MDLEIFPLRSAMPSFVVPMCEVPKALVAQGEGELSLSLVPRND